jgi:hypothetical protein
MLKFCVSEFILRLVSHLIILYQLQGMCSVHRRKTTVMYFGEVGQRVSPQNYEAELPEYYPPPPARRWTKKLRVTQSLQLLQSGKSIKIVQTTISVKTR